MLKKIKAQVTARRGLPAATPHPPAAAAAAAGAPPKKKHPAQAAHHPKTRALFTRWRTRLRGPSLALDEEVAEPDRSLALVRADHSHAVAKKNLK